MKMKPYAPIMAIIALSALLGASSAFSTPGPGAVEPETSPIEATAVDVEFSPVVESCSVAPLEAPSSSGLKPKKNECIPGSPCTGNKDCRGAGNNPDGTCLPVSQTCACPN